MSTENDFDSNYGSKQMGFKEALAAMEKTGKIPTSIDEAMEARNAPADSGGGSRELEGQSKSTADLMNEQSTEQVQEQDQNQEIEQQAQDDNQEQVSDEGSQEDPDLSSEEGTQPDVETVMADGKELEIDWSNRDDIKRAIQKSVMLNAEKKAKDAALSQRDEALSAHKVTQEDNTRQADILTKIETAKTAGVEAVVQLLFNKPMSEFVAEYTDMESWSEEKMDSYKAGLENKRIRAELDSIKASAEADKLAAENDRNEASNKRVQNHFEASYRTHTLDGKLGDSDLEDDLNDRMFEKVKAKFGDYDTDDIHEADIEEAMKAEQRRILTIYKRSEGKRTSAEIDKKKKAALSSAQARTGAREPRKTVAAKLAAATQKPNSWQSILGDPGMRAELERRK